MLSVCTPHRKPSRVIVAVIGLLLTLALPTPAAAQDLSQPGPYAVGWSRVTVTRPNATTFTSLLYYPALTDGRDTVFDPSGGPYPGITFGHGYLTNPSNYESTYEHLASWGYFVHAPESGLELFPNHQRFADDLRYCLDDLESRNADNQSPFFGGVDVLAFALSGHSMGGGCSLVAAADEGPRLRAVANLAAAETNVSAIAAMAEITIPVSLISGSSDSITPLRNHGQLMYDNGIGPRTLPVITGGSHCGFLDGYTLGCDFGDIPRADQLRLTRRLLTAFFNLYLKEDQSAWPLVWGVPTVLDPEVRTQSDPGITFSPRAGQATGARGTEVVYSIEITNTGPVANDFTLAIETSRWPTRLEPTGTPLLAPGESVMVEVIVSVPETGSNSDIAVISALSSLDGLTRQIGGVRTRVAP